MVAPSIPSNSYRQTQPQKYLLELSYLTRTKLGNSPSPLHHSHKRLQLFHRLEPITVLLLNSPHELLTHQQRYDFYEMVSSNLSKHLYSHSDVLLIDNTPFVLVTCR